MKPASTVLHVENLWLTSSSALRLIGSTAVAAMTNSLLPVVMDAMKSSELVSKDKFLCFSNKSETKK